MPARLSRRRRVGQIDPASLRAAEDVEQQRFLRLEELGGGGGEYPSEDLDLDVPFAGTESDQTHPRQAGCRLDQWVGSDATAKLGQQRLDPRAGEAAGKADFVLEDAVRSGRDVDELRLGQIGVRNRRQGAVRPADPRGAGPDRLHCPAAGAEADLVADAEGAVGEEGDAPQQVLDGGLRGERERDAADADAGEQAHARYADVVRTVEQDAARRDQRPDAGHDAQQVRVEGIFREGGRRDDGLGDQPAGAPGRPGGCHVEREGGDQGLGACDLTRGDDLPGDEAMAEHDQDAEQHRDREPERVAAPGRARPSSSGRPATAIAGSTTTMVAAMKPVNSTFQIGVPSIVACSDAGRRSRGSRISQGPTMRCCTVAQSPIALGRSAGRPSAWAWICGSRATVAAEKT